MSLLQVFGENRSLHYFHGEPQVHDGEKSPVLDASRNRALVQHRLEVTVSILSSDMLVRDDKFPFAFFFEWVIVVGTVVHVSDVDYCRFHFFPVKQGMSLKIRNLRVARSALPILRCCYLRAEHYYFRTLQ